MSRIFWTNPAADRLIDEVVPAERVGDDADSRFFNKRYAKMWYPSVPSAKGPKDELILLLKVAAEIEHTLLVQYLYAAYSIPDETNDVRSKIVNVLIQEMGHLLAVQNLLLCIGGISNLHLQKSDLRPSSADNPLPYSLEPLSRIALAKFVVIEAPPEIPDALKLEIEAIHQTAKQSVDIPLNPVGGLYAKILWLFQKDDEPLAELPLIANAEFKTGNHVSDKDFTEIQEIAMYEANRDSWDTSGSVGAHDLKLYEVHNREDAIKLILDISFQGEGANFSDDIKSHFEIFLNAYRAWDPNATTIFNATANPVTIPNTEFSVSSEVKNPYTLKWNSLFNLLYTSLLLDIHNTMFYKQFSTDLTDGYIRLIYSNMRTVIKTLSNILYKLPLDDNGFTYDSAPRSGPTFEIDDQLVMNSVRADADNLNKKFVNRILAQVEEIRQSDDFPEHLEKDGSEENAMITLSLSQIENYCSRKMQLLGN